MYRYAEQFHPSQHVPPLSRYYGTLTGNQVGVPLGIASHALDELRASLMGAKTKWGVTVKAQQYIQIRYAPCRRAVPGRASICPRDVL